MSRGVGTCGLGYRAGDPPVPSARETERLDAHRASAQERVAVVLSFANVEKRFGSMPASCGVSMEVGSGEIFGLIGPNGAGKTTLLRMILDIVRPDSGNITLFGAPVSRRLLDRVGYLPESLSLYRRRRVMDTLVYAGELKGLVRSEARARADAWLGRINLTAAARSHVGRLSKGMAQKVALAATFLSDPDLCVLDEPFSGLDPVNARWISDQLVQRRSEGKTTILSTHEMHRVESLCDRIGLLHRGQMILYGAVDEIRRGHTRAEVDVELTGTPPELAEIEAVEHLTGRTWRVEVADGCEPDRLLAALVSAGARVHRFSPRSTPLEEIFLRKIEEVAP